MSNERAAVIVLLRDGRVERGELVALAGIDRLDYLLDRAPERVGEARTTVGERPSSIDSRSA